MASSFAARLLRRLSGGGGAHPVEILPPDKAESNIRAEPAWDLNASVEARADAFASLFLNAAPKDLRQTRIGQSAER